VICDFLDLCISGYASKFRLYDFIRCRYFFCMVCKLWYISIRCIFKNLALKLRIYNFRGVCVYICPPHLPSPSPQSFPPILLLSYLFHYSSGVRSVCYFVSFLLFASIPIVVDHLLYLFLYSIYYLISLWELYIYCF